MILMTPNPQRTKTWRERKWRRRETAGKERPEAWADLLQKDKRNGKKHEY
jgi:hypothetical protein